MTSKGQVTVPKDIRDALGLKPGSVVGFEIDANGDARILKHGSGEAVRKQALVERLSAIRTKFGEADPFQGISTDAYMALIREPIQPFEAESLE